jgi:hypothetical protein
MKTNSISDFKMDNKLTEEYIQWLNDTGRMSYELTNIVVNYNENYRFEKKMAWVSHNTPNDYKAFCEATGREYDGTMQLLAIY